MLYILWLFLLLLPTLALAESYTATPGTAQGLLGRLGPGDTLVLQPGEYPPLRPRPGQAGRAGAPITVTAAQEGTVLVHAHGDGAAIRLTDGNNYWRFQGLNACCAGRGASVVTVGSDANYNRFARMIAWDAEGHWSGAPWETFGNVGNVFVDIAGWGKGRKAMARIGDRDTVVLRGFFMKNYFGSDRQTGICHSNGGIGFTYAYKSRNTFTANTIATMDFEGNCRGAHSIFGTDHYTGAVNWGTVQNTIAGNIGYHVAPQQLAAVHGVFQDAVPGTIPAGTTVTTQSRNNMAIRRHTSGPQMGLFSYNLGTDRRAFQSRDHWTDSQGSLQSGPHTTDTGPQPLQAFQNGLLQLAATQQPPFGAWIKHCYTEARTLDTGCHLWPWPMNDRIKQALRQSGYAARGLDGQGETDLTALIMRLTGTSFDGKGGPGPIQGPGPFPLPPPTHLRVWVIR